MKENIFGNFSYQGDSEYLRLSSAVEKEEGLMTYTGTSHWGATQTLWLPFWGALILSMFMDNLWFKLTDEEAARLVHVEEAT